VPFNGYFEAIPESEDQEIKTGGIVRKKTNTARETMRVRSTVKWGATYAILA
jgi:hypothetical protein